MKKGKIREKKHEHKKVFQSRNVINEKAIEVNDDIKLNSND